MHKNELENNKRRKIVFTCKISKYKGTQYFFESLLYGPPTLGAYYEESLEESFPKKSSCKIEKKSFKFEEKKFSFINSANFQCKPKHRPDMLGISLGVRAQ
jgi:hypothetical protein